MEIEYGLLLRPWFRVNHLRRCSVSDAMKACWAGVVASGILVLGGIAWAAPNASIAELTIPANESQPPKGALLRLGFRNLEQGSGIRGFAVSPDGQLTATSGYLAGAPIKLRRIGSRELVAELVDDTHGSGSLAFSPDGTLLAAGSNRDATVRIWDITTGRRREILRTADYPQFSTNLPTWIAFAPDGKTLASASPLGTVEVWHLANARVLDSTVPAAKERKVQNRLSQSIAISPDGKLLAVATIDGMVRIYDYPALQQRDEINAGTLSSVNSLAFSSNSRFIAYTGNVRAANFQAGEGAYLYDLEAKRVVRKFAGDVGQAGPIGYGYTTAFVPGTDQLISLDFSGGANLWELSTGQLNYTVPTEGLKLIVAPDGETFITVDNRGSIKYWNVADGKEINSYPGTAIPRPRQETNRSF